VSHIFEALQRSVTESTGVVPDLAIFPTELAGIPSNHTDLAFPKTSTITMSPKPENRLVVLTHPESIGAEQFRFLAVKLRQFQSNRGVKRLLVTSTIPEEGKSLVSASLAITLARRQPKVLLLEGDLRRPTLSKVLGIPKYPGISEYLQSSEENIPAIYKMEPSGFYFLPAGAPPENPLELLQLPKLTNLLEQFTRCFDWLVIDSPPVLPLADTTIWSKISDATLLVAREGKTEKTHLKRGLEALGTSKLLGVVLNSCSAATNGQYYYRYKSLPPLTTSDTSQVK
jgi:capsular exopolysaccharide synthesis family protein